MDDQSTLTPHIGDMVQIEGLITIFSDGRARRTLIGNASGLVVRRRTNKFWMVQVVEHGECLVHESAFTSVAKPIEFTRAQDRDCGKPINLV